MNAFGAPGVQVRSRLSDQYLQRKVKALIVQGFSVF